MATETAFLDVSATEPALGLRFGPFTMDLRTRELRRAGTPVHLQQQPFKVLTVLASHPGALVTREEIRREVWGPDIYVDFDQSLNFCVKQIRSVLGDQADTPRYVETLPRRGYRFIAPVEVLGSDGTLVVPRALVPDLVSDASPRAEALVGRPATSRYRVAGALLLAALLGAGAWLSERGRRPSGVQSPPNGRVMLAVLPFENMSNDPAQEYFSDGLTEEMITELARLGPGRLGVIARTSSSVYKGTHESVDRIGRELGVDYLLEGSVRRSGDRVRVTAQLIQVKDQTHLWAEAYERRMADVLRLQDELSARIVGSLEARLGASPSAALAGSHPAAYEDYLKGRYHLGRRPIGVNEGGPAKSVGYFQQAIAQDPDFAAAHAGLASAYVALSEEGGLPPQEAFPKARAAAERAIALDGGIAEAHTALAVTRMYFDWDWAGAGESFTRALELDPGRAPTLHAYAGFLSAQRRHAEALAAIDRARVLDPLSAAVNGDLGWYLYFARRYDDAIAQYKKALELEPGLGWVHSFLFDAYVQKGDLAEAKALGLAALREDKVPVALLDQMQRADGPAAVRIYVGQAIANIRKISPPPAEFLAARLAQAGQREEALTWLEKAADVRSRWLVSLVLVEPKFDGIRADPRFSAVIRRVGLTP